MAFPYVFHSNFESGDNSEWDSESDTDGILDFPHYSELARFRDSNSTPFSGAYCARIVPAGGTADATLTEGDINITDTTTNYFSFPVWFGSDFDATANDTFALLELQGAASAVTVSIGARYVASTDVINIGCGAAASAAAPTAFASWGLARNTWYTVEATVVIQTGGTGSVNVFITKEGDAAQTTADCSVSTVTNIAVTDGVFGLQDHLATTTGTILLGGLIQDDARIYPDKRFSHNPEVRKSGHVFVGPGSIDSAALLTTGGSNVMQLYDTDTADTNQYAPKVELDQDRNTSFGGPMYFEKGCYVSLSGTNPRGSVNFWGIEADAGFVAPKYHSSAGMRRWGLG